MKNKKTVLHMFTIFQWEQEQEFLSLQHTKGWKFTGLSGFCYHFEKCEPDDVVYQIDYCPENDKSAYIRLFNDCGWEYLQDFCGYSYFRKPRNKMEGSEESIFCDDLSRLEMLKRIFKYRLIPVIVLFFCTVLPQLFRQICLWNEGEGNNIITVVCGVMFVLYLLIFAVFALHYYKFWKKVKR